LSDSDFLKRVPPHSTDAEMAVLGGILLDNQAINHASEILKAEDFYREHHRTIYSAMVGLSNRGIPIDITTLTEALGGKDFLERVGGAGYLAEIVSYVPSASHTPHYSRIVREKSVLRALGAAATEIAANSYESQRDVADFLATAESQITSIARLDLGVPEPSLKHAVDEVVLSVERGELAGVPSGFSELDRNLAGGGFGRGSLNIIAAPTGLGKTALAGNIAVRAKRGGTLFCTIEMDRAEMIRRLIADLGYGGWASIARRRPP
jgi:replicative DNA helicase